MAGNVLEHVYDYFGRYSSEREVDPTGPVDGNTRVGRGGTFLAGDAAMRTATRGGGPADVGYFETGFRVAFPLSSTLDE
jgi:formylglycine-generating enzyme required for sulfatase activity